MKLTYLDSTIPDLLWVRTYHERVFPEDGYNAAARFEETERLLIQQPLVGPPLGKHGLRQRRVSNTPVSLIYRVLEDEVEIVRVRDTRSA